MTGPDLKPCPFCGEKMPAHDDTSYIRCMGCGAESGWRATPEDVTAAWNRRDPAVLAALPEVQALIAAAYEAAAAFADSSAKGGCSPRNLAKIIRALTPADATAALAARDAAMRAQGLREAAYEVRPALTAPRDGTLVRLLLDYSDEENWVPLEDKIQAWTIGYNTLADAGDDEWIIVGWDWSQDCWCEGSGKIIGWLPFVPQAPADATAALAARDAAMIARGMREAATLLREQGYGTAPKQILARAAEIEGDSK